MKENQRQLTLYRPASYQIKVPGRLAEDSVDCVGMMTIAVEGDCEGQMVTALTGTIDQAALHGLLRFLYATGFPIISVICLDVVQVGI